MTDVTSAKTARRYHHWRRDVTELAALFTAVAVADAIANLIGHQPDGPYLLIASAVALAVTAAFHTWWARGHSHAPPPTRTELISDSDSVSHRIDAAATALVTTPTGAGPALPPEDTVLWRMRTTVQDIPGSLAALCIVLARHRVDILTLQTHPLAEGTVDEFLLRAPAPLQAQQLSREISAAGAAAPGSSGPTRTTWWTPRRASWALPHARPWTPPNSPSPCVNCSAAARSIRCPPSRSPVEQPVRPRPSRACWRRR